MYYCTLYHGAPSFLWQHSNVLSNRPYVTPIIDNFAVYVVIKRGALPIYIFPAIYLQRSINANERCSIIKLGLQFIVHCGTWYGPIAAFREVNMNYIIRVRLVNILVCQSWSHQIFGNMCCTRRCPPCYQPGA